MSKLKAADIEHVSAKRVCAGDYVIEGGSGRKVHSVDHFTNGWGEKLVQINFFDGFYGPAFDPEQTFAVIRSHKAL